MDKAKELSKDPFKIKNKQEKELVVINKILDNNKKVIDSEKDEKLTIEIEKLLLKTKDAIQAHIRGNVLTSLGYVDFAKMFFDKATELGYTVNENTELATAQADEDLEVENQIKEKLLNKTISKITKSDTDTQLTVVDIIFEFGNIILKMNDETTESLSYNDVDKLLRGFQVVKLAAGGAYYALMLENPVDEKKNMNENMNITQENIDNLKQNIINKEVEYYFDGFESNSGVKITNAELLEDNTIHIEFEGGTFQELTYEQFLNFINNEQIIIENNQGEKVGLKILNTELTENNINEDYELYAEIANDLFSKIQAIKAETGKFTTKDLEEQILNNGGTLEMVDGVMAELVNMGFDFDNEVEETNQNLFDLINNRYELSEIMQSNLKSVLNDYENAITVEDRNISINAIATIVDDSFDNVSQLLADNLISNETYKQTLPLAEELKNYNLFGLDVPEKDKTDHTPEAIFGLINSDPFLKFSYHELNTGDFEKDMEMIYKTYIKDNDDLVARLATFESYTSMLKENSLSKSPNINIIEIILNKNNVNPENFRNELYKTDLALNDILTKWRNEFVLLTPNIKSELRDKFNQLSHLEIADMVLSSQINKNNTTEDNINKLSEKFNISLECATFVYNMFSNIIETITFIDDMQLLSLIIVSIISIVLKTL